MNFVYDFGSSHLEIIFFDLNYLFCFRSVKEVKVFISMFAMKSFLH